MTSSLPSATGASCWARDPDVLALLLGGHRLAAPEQGVAAQGDDDAHRCGPQSPIVATRTALIVCIRFSAWSNTIDAGRLEDLVGDLHLGDAEVLEHLLADLGVPVVERRQAVHELRVAGLPVAAIARRVDLVRREQLDALRPDLLGLAHRDPHVGVQVVGALDALRRPSR